MYFALVYYPEIEHRGFQAFRRQYEPYSELLPEHVPFVYPVPESIGRKQLEEHIKNVLDKWSPFEVHFCTLEKSWDHWLYLGIREGHDKIVELHDELYKGLLSPYLRHDLPYYPHIALGLFSKEGYDFSNPTAELTLDEENYNIAFRTFEALKFDLWCRVDKLCLVAINESLTESRDLEYFMI